ncbi:hypothetical protein [Nonomuraea indica]|uniref:hypothetical protein n=1 Tax=Nonomuraea indica TaxID=1581193 RepID=UPI000C79E596|nr:hypothetical protein [Nonomuraea indica]
MFPIPKEEDSMSVNPEDPWTTGESFHVGDGDYERPSIKDELIVHAVLLSEAAQAKADPIGYVADKAEKIAKFLRDADK